MMTVLAIGNGGAAAAWLLGWLGQGVVYGLMHGHVDARNREHHRRGVVRGALPAAQHPFDRGGKRPSLRWADENHHVGLADDAHRRTRRVQTADVDDCEFSGAVEQRPPAAHPFEGDGAVLAVTFHGEGSGTEDEDGFESTKNELLKISLFA